MTHEYRAARRKRMAGQVRAGKLMDDVARDFGVSMKLVEQACHEHRVVCQARRVGCRGRVPKLLGLRVLARLQQGDETPQAIAAELNCTRQYVHWVRDEALAAGIKLPEWRIPTVVMGEPPQNIPVHEACFTPGRAGIV